MSQLFIFENKEIITDLGPQILGLESEKERKLTEGGKPKMATGEYRLI